MRTVSRRVVLRRTAITAVGVSVALKTGAAKAFRLDPAADYAATITDGCGVDLDHERLIAEAESVLGVDRSDAAGRARIAAITCPGCGCSIMAGLLGAEDLTF